MLVKNNNIVLRSIHGSYFLIDITDNYKGDKCALYEINETGKFLWDGLDKTDSLKTLTTLFKAALIDEIPYEVLFDDVSDFINDLKDKHFVLEVANNG